MTGVLIRVAANSWQLRSNCTSVVGQQAYGNEKSADRQDGVNEVCEAKNTERREKTGETDAISCVLPHRASTADLSMRMRVVATLSAHCTSAFAKVEGTNQHDIERKKAAKKKKEEMHFPNETPGEAGTQKG